MVAHFHGEKIENPLVHYCKSAVLDENMDFVCEYSEHLRNPDNPTKYTKGRQWTDCPYSDPDKVNYVGVSNKLFYKNLTLFLNKQLQNKGLVDDGHDDKNAILKIKGGFCEPTNEKMSPIWYEATESEIWNPSDKTISAELTDGTWLYLTSDQFGFSHPVRDKHKWKEFAGGRNGFKGAYPYGRYLELRNGDHEFVAQCIYDTRTIGGSFIWPKVYHGSWSSPYNAHRGAGSYIEDRVDLTLLEIKEFYEAYNECAATPSQEAVGQLLETKTNNRNILLKYGDREAIFKWLTVFKSFENYIKFFCLDDFAPKGNVIDIANSTVVDENEESAEDKKNIVYLECGYNKYDCIKEINDAQDIRRLLENVRILVLRRSKKMEDIIRKND